MILTAAFLTLKLLTVYLAPADPLSQADQALATCVQEEMTKRPSALTFAKTAEGADATLTVSFVVKGRPHTIGVVTRADGTVLGSVDLPQSVGLFGVYDVAKFKACHNVTSLIKDLTKALTTRRAADASPRLLTVPIAAFLLASQLDAGTSYWGETAHGLGETNPLYAHVSPSAAVAIGAGVDTLQVLLWRRVGRQHPQWAKTGLWVSTALRMEATIQTVRLVR